MIVQKLNELNDENARAQADSEVETATTEEEVTQEAVEETSNDSEEVAEPSQNEGQEDTTPAWMQAGDDTSDDDTYLTDSDAAAIRRKWKGKLQKVEEEKDSEINKLRAEVEALKGGGQYHPTMQIKKPTREEFDYDDDKYEEALGDYYAKLVKSNLESDNQKAQQQKAIEQQQQAMSQRVDGHYERAAKLSKESGISAEDFAASDKAVRRVVASIPNFGEQGADLAVDALISQMGEGSEKLMYYMGRNTHAQAKFKAALEEDPTGIKAMFLLGEMKAKVMEPVKKVSTAKKPAAQAKGEGEQKSVTNWKRKYDKAKSPQERFAIRREAKKAGENTGNW